MTAYEFDLVVGGLDLDADQDKLAEFETRVDDVTFASHGHTVTAAVEREAGTLAEAIRSAIADVETIPSVRVERILPDEYVSQAEIAGRTGRSRQSVSQLVNGIRGPGGFPAPSFGKGRTALWRWAAVAAWLAEAGLLDAAVERHQSAVIDAANALLEARRATTLLKSSERATLGRLVLA